MAKTHSWQSRATVEVPGQEHGALRKKGGSGGSYWSLQLKGYWNQVRVSLFSQVAEQEEMVSGHASRGLDWILWKNSSWKGISSTGTDCPGNWWSHHPWRVQMQRSGTLEALAQLPSSNTNLPLNQKVKPHLQASPSHNQLTPLETQKPNPGFILNPKIHISSGAVTISHYYS